MVAIREEFQLILPQLPCIHKAVQKNYTLLSWGEGFYIVENNSGLLAGKSLFNLNSSMDQWARCFSISIENTIENTRAKVGVEPGGNLAAEDIKKGDSPYPLGDHRQPTPVLALA
jgi:hypothetical protein